MLWSVAGRPLFTARVLLVVALLTCCSSQDASVVELHSSKQLPGLLLNPAVSTVILVGDIQLSSAEWANTTLPIVLQRNFTIQGDVRSSTVIRHMDLSLLLSSKVRQHFKVEHADWRKKN